MTPSAQVVVTISRGEIMLALQQMILDNSCFHHTAWALWDAEQFEAAARLIREGYAAAVTTKE